MGPEAKIQSRVVKYARSLGVLAYKFNSDGNRGVPDYLFIANSTVIFIEFKAEGKRPTALQLNEHKKIKDRGIDVWVCDDVFEGQLIIDRLLL